MKKTTMLCILLLMTLQWISAQDDSPVSFGFHFLMGGRYDDVRMCVASPAGAKGGTIAEIYLDVQFKAGENGVFSINMPVMRPILFAAAFNMLQFEPQVSYEYFFGQNDNPQVVLGGGLGLVFHYGPDFQSSQEERGPSFLAMGPLFTGFAGLNFEGNKGSWMPGIKAFYSPLFSSAYPFGQVLGGGLELHYNY